jgi:hypothetical protein
MHQSYCTKMLQNRPKYFVPVILLWLMYDRQPEIPGMYMSLTLGLWLAKRDMRMGICNRRLTQTCNHDAASCVEGPDTEWHPVRPVSQNVHLVKKTSLFTLECGPAPSKGMPLRHGSRIQRQSTGPSETSGVDDHVRLQLPGTRHSQHVQVHIRRGPGKSVSHRIHCHGFFIRHVPERPELL